jgi:hypothetical protein
LRFGFPLSSLQHLLRLAISGLCGLTLLLGLDVGPECLLFSRSLRLGLKARSLLFSSDVRLRSPVLLLLLLPLQVHITSKLTRGERSNSNGARHSTEDATCRAERKGRKRRMRTSELAVSTAESSRCAYMGMEFWFSLAGKLAGEKVIVIVKRNSVCVETYT